MQGSRITYVYKDQEHDVAKVGMGDLVAFEDFFDLPASVLEPETTEDENGNIQLVGVFKLKWMAYLIFRSARREGVIAKDMPFDADFIDDIDEFSIEGAEVTAEADPDAEVVPAEDPSPVAASLT